MLFTDWRRPTARALRDAGLGAGMGLLSVVTPQMGYFPDFLNRMVHQVTALGAALLRGHHC